jgi:hypothetical protein
MKKLTVGFVCICFMASCSIFHKEKYGCPGSPEANGGMTNDQKILSGDQKTIEKEEKTKLKTAKSAY